MAGRFIQPARQPGAGLAAPDVLSGKYKTGETFKKGAVLIYDANGELTVAGTAPIIDIAGIALQAAGSGPGRELSGASNVLQVTGLNQEVSFAKANLMTVFSARGKSAAGGDGVTPTQTQIGEEAGFSVDATGTWRLDLDLVDAAVIVDIDIDQKIYFFKFLQAAIAEFS